MVGLGPYFLTKKCTLPFFRQTRGNGKILYQSYHNSLLPEVFVMLLSTQT